MLEISPEKIAHVIIRAREYDSGVNAWAHSGQRRGHGTETELAEFIAALNDMRLYASADDSGSEAAREDRQRLIDWLAFCQDSLLEALMG